jgi:hypothetical protein
MLATYGTDSVGTDSVSGYWSLAQDPYHSTAPSFTVPIAITGAGSFIGTGPGGGTLILGNNTPPQYSVPRTRVVRYSMLEAMRSEVNISGSIQNGNALVVDPTSGGVYQALEANSSFIPIAICKPMDGATITDIKIWFFVPSQPATVPVGIAVTLKRFAATAAPNAFPVGENEVLFTTPQAWFNNGQPQSISISNSAVVVGASISSGGGSYSGPPAVTFSAPGGGGVTATGTAVMTGSGSSQSVASITITNPGSGYASIPTISFSPTGAVATPILNPTAPLGFTGGGTNVMDLSTYVYRIEIDGPGTPSSPYLPNPIFTGVEITYSVTSEQFSQ